MNSDFSAAFRLWPQMVVTVGAIVTIPVGSYLHHLHHHHLPEGAFIGNLFWLTLNAALAIKALTFVTSRMRQRRSGHRFPLPVVARLRLAIDGEQKDILAIAEDISSDGLNLAVDRQLTLEGKIEGTLLLPTVPAPFRGAVLRTIQVKGSLTKLVGLKFEWIDGSDSDTLNSCLYGNTLQWDVNSWAEVRRFNPSRLTANLRLRVSHGDSRAGLQVTGYRQYVIGGASVHLAILAEEPLNATGFHREPSWTRVQEIR